MQHHGPSHTFGARADDSWTYRGLEAAVLENEWLRALILTGKGGDAWSLVFKPTDTEFLWRAPGGVRNPSAWRPLSGGGDQLWLDVYEGGWQSVFPNGGNPSAYGGAEFGLHAESSTLPWDCVVSGEGPEVAELTLTACLARAPIAARRTLSLEAGSPVLTVRETLVNTSPAPYPISYGQHLVFGPPFLSERCLIDLPGGRVRTHPVGWSSANRFAPGTVTEWPEVLLVDGKRGRVDVPLPPGSGSEDQAYVDDLEGGWYAITNTQLGVGLAVSYPLELYRHLWYWQVCGGPFRYPWWGRTYSLGLEPFTSATNQGVAAAVDDGSALMLEPSRPITSVLRLSAYRSSAGVLDVTDVGDVCTRD